MSGFPAKLYIAWCSIWRHRPEANLGANMVANGPGVKSGCQYVEHTTKATFRTAVAGTLCQVCSLRRPAPILGSDHVVIIDRTKRKLKYGRVK